MHSKLELTLHAEDERGCDLTQDYRILAKPLVKRQLERELARGLEEDGIDSEELGYPR